MEGNVTLKKYDYEFKKKVVEEYLEGEHGYRYLAQKYQMPTDSLIERWVKAYKVLGDDGLKPHKSKRYTFQFKLDMVESYLASGMSIQEFALSVGMSDPGTISSWINSYQTGGSNALRPKSERRKPKMPKTKKSGSEKLSDTSNEEYLKELEEENLRLRIENAYLKEMRRLRLEDEARNGRQESSTVSEDRSN